MRCEWEMVVRVLRAVIMRGGLFMRGVVMNILLIFATFAPKKSPISLNYLLFKALL